jgi:hypothetical protein
MMRKITLLRHYQNMKGQSLKPETYSIDDPMLGGLASYLVENGYAEWVAEESAVADVTPEAPEESASNVKRKRKRS